MQKIIIKKGKDKTGNIEYLVSAISFKQNKGTVKKIPHPMGTDVMSFKTVEEAVDAIKVSGFESILPDGNSLEIANINENFTDNNWKDAIGQTLLSELKNTDNSIQTAAISSLGELEDEDFIPIFINKMGEDNDNLRNSAIDAVVKSGYKAVEAIKEALNDDIWVRRKSAVICIEKMVTTGNVDAEIFFKALLQATKDTNVIVKSSVIKALGNIYKVYKEKNNERRNKDFTKKNQHV